MVDGESRAGGAGAGSGPAATRDGVGDNAELYDIENAFFDYDIPFWESLIEELRPRRVLELACGTGRLLLPMAVKGRALVPGFRIVGLDKSATFLAAARQKLAEADPGLIEVVTLVEGDMTAFDLQSRFDLIVLGFNGLGVLRTIDDQLACLGTARRHLAPGGRFTLDQEMPPLELLAEFALPWPPLRLAQDLPPVPAFGISRVLIYAADRYDSLTQTAYRHFRKEFLYEDGRQVHVVHDLDLHLYFPREMELLVRLAGLVPIEQYGSYRRAPFDQRSSRFLWVTRADEAASDGASPEARPAANG
jgi:SAM-dependent methyltransferase